MLLNSPYSNPTIWASEVNIYIIEVLKLLSRKLELQAINLKEDFRLNKVTQSDEDNVDYEDSHYSPVYYDVYEGIDGINFAIDDLFEEHLPSLIRSSAFVTIYSSLEFEIQKLCTILQVKENFSKRYHELRGKGLVQAFEYLEKIAGMGIDKSSIMWKQFKAINEIRNLIVHNDGKIQEKKKGIMNSYKEMAIPGVQFKYEQDIVLKEGYLEYVIDFFSVVVAFYGKKLCEKYPE